jgi:N-methylhydantoinase A
MTESERGDAAPATSFTIGIDTGGTFTDSFMAEPGGGHWTVKVPTTPHDLTVCFAEAIDQSAAAAGISRRDLLRRTSVIRFSSTIGTNTALTLSGPKLGLIVTAGQETSLYGAAGDERIFRLVQPGMVVGIAERVTEKGAVESQPDATEVDALVRDLLERGARILVVSLANASANAANELEVLRIVNASYPRHYLGAVPTLLSTNVSAAADDAGRTAAAVVNAYMHRKLATSLYKAEDDLRRSGLRQPLLIVAADGSVSRVAKTRALSTYQSGPAAGVHGSSVMCRTYGIAAALTADVGGTSTDFGLVVDGHPLGRARVEVAGLDVPQDSVELFSIALGGGSIARVENGSVRVGPESAGAAPGPACFGMGGTDPTPTDAWLVLGYLDPENFLGGRRKLLPELSRSALEQQIGQPLGLSVEEAAAAVRDAAEEIVASGIEEMLSRPAGMAALKDMPPKDLAMIAYGGAGGVLLPSVARRAGLGSVYLSSLSAVFSAFGVSTFDVQHRYQARTTAATAADGTLQRLLDAAHRDVRGEGFDAGAARFSVTVLDEDGTILVDDVAPAKLGPAMKGLRTAADQPVTLSLSATCEVNKPGLPLEIEADGPDPKSASTGTRRILTGEGAWDVPVYSRERLRSGHVLEGPCLIDSSGSTYLVPEGANCVIDRFGTAIVGSTA